MSRSPTTLYVGSNTSQKTKPVTFELADIRALTIDFSAYCGIEGALIDAATWSIVDSVDFVSIGDATTTTKTTSAPVTAVDTGIAMVQVSTVFDNGETIIQLFRCEVKDPEREITHLQDYQT